MSTLAEKRFSYFSSRVLGMLVAAFVVNNFVYQGGYAVLGVFVIIGIIWGAVGALMSDERDLSDY